MLTVLLVALLFAISNADVETHCSNSSDTSLTFVPANDGVDGRYRVEWCTTPKSKDKVTSWELTLRCKENTTEDKCHGDAFLYVRQGHSFFNKDVNITNLNCTNVCFATNLDLIFNGTCYLVKTFLHYGKISGSPEDHLFYITNAYPKERFTNSDTRISIQSFNNEQLTVMWFLSYIPATDYTMSLCVLSNTTNDEACADVSRYCGARGRQLSEVRCELRAAYGRYNMRLQHCAPWDTSPLFRRLTNANRVFTHAAERAPRDEGGGDALWWVGAALLLALALAALLAAAARCRRAPPLEWAAAENKGVGAEMVGAGGAGGGGGAARDKVLLLYARDCAPLMRLAARLRTLLARAADGPVYDLYELGTWRAAAGAPGEWVRRALARDDVRVVLLQAPAAAHLCRPAQRDNLALEQPLLGRAVVYRAPAAADALAALALRLLHEAAHTRPALAYRKCYKATISGLKVDLAPTITPLRWYELPKDILLLLRDLDPSLFPPDAPSAPSADTPNTPNTPTSLQLDADFRQELQDFNEAVDELLDYVRENPGYLNDEVLCI
ncbi:uncharacterized protein LOC119834380 [Zerene cesonia]|uniref:uncharacterized protein LOC119834380 n=1 Tax=Zerene cesonia TaxID=33412 RepID=UPI0018E4E847|nr:uncharacterized protein LOC119834380 [Zerene cesonia]